VIWFWVERLKVSSLVISITICSQFVLCHCCYNTSVVRPLLVRILLIYSIEQTAVKGVLSVEESKEGRMR